MNLFKMRKNIIITGANGFIATNLITNLKNGYSLYLISTHINDLKEKYKDYKDIHCYTLNEFADYTKKENILFYSLIHTAFSRSSNGQKIMESILYLKDVLHLSTSLKLYSFINISSQSVYGLNNPPFWKEDDSISPHYLYGLGKAISETFTSDILSNTTIKWTNIRLASVMGTERFVSLFVNNIIQGKNITVLGGKQTCSFIDIKDVVDAISLMLNKTDIEWNKVYNLGTGKNYSILEIAQHVIEIGNEKYKLKGTINKEQSDIKQDVGMDITLFRETFGWTPRYDIEDMIVSLYEKLINN